MAISIPRDGNGNQFVARFKAKNGAAAQVEVLLSAAQMLGNHPAQRQELVRAKVKEALEQMLAEITQEEQERLRELKRQAGDDPRWTETPPDDLP
ncbi:hypothetical protein [Bradyrhizobium sp. SZCCHNS3004]|uniref:hypothetical protein n=1 Tax=Bradyrhizobium sp. SZCCHNS3004 TaxID=3057312 RepID=UPI0029165683|nr:hypothetical protein [Bradyrhizobium sp. SZCCHNS3004]